MGFAGNPKEPSAMRGGPIFEFLFGIDTQLRKEGRRERFDITFFSPAEKPGNRLGPKAVDGLLARCASATSAPTWGTSSRVSATARS